MAYLNALSTDTLPLEPHKVLELTVLVRDIVDGCDDEAESRRLSRILVCSGFGLAAAA